MPIVGFVDIQINGWGGVDFSSETLTPAQVEEAFDAIEATGTVGYLPTVITSTVATYVRTRVCVRPAHKPHCEHTTVSRLMLYSRLLAPRTESPHSLSLPTG
jgi:N-acetylglucosamine-6-phosphate deacetylase